MCNIEKADKVTKNTAKCFRGQEKSRSYSQVLLAADIL